MLRRKTAREREKLELSYLVQVLRDIHKRQ